MIPQAIEVEPTKGCRICGQTDGSDTLTAYILCLEHRQLAVHAPVLQARNADLLAALEAMTPDYEHCAPDMGGNIEPDRVALIKQARAAIAAAKGQG